eukprot:jgi/Botrbrau1/9347/Bobra.354_2s0006.1
MQVAMQMGAAVPYPAPHPATFFGLAPHMSHQPTYSSMDPQQQGTRIPAPGEPNPTHAAPLDDGPNSKRPRLDSQVAPGLTFAAHCASNWMLLCIVGVNRVLLAPLG